MKMRFLALTIFVMTAQCCFSQDTLKRTDSVSIPIEYIRAANRIFIEHDYLKDENRMLRMKESLYKRSLSSYAKIDSAYSVKITRYEISDKELRNENRKIRKALIYTTALNVLLLILAL